MIRSATTAVVAPRGYPGPMKAIHWATAGLLIGTYAAAWLIGDTSSPARTD